MFMLLVQNDQPVQFGDADWVCGLCCRGKTTDWAVAEVEYHI